MKKVLLLVVMLMIANAICLAQHLQINHQPIIWLDANHPGNNINRWEDISGNQYHAYTDTGQIIPGQAYFNFNRCFVFDSSTKALKIHYMPGSNENNTVLTVYHTKNTSDELGLWYLYPDTLVYCFLSTQRIKSTSSTVKYTDTNFTKAIINTSMQKWKKIHVDSLHSYQLIGGTDSLSYRGKFAEFMMFNTTLKGKELQKVHTYLAIKYGISLVESDYLISNENVIWDKKKNKIYNKEIAGIGRDSLLNIDQKQSSADGGNNILTISADKLLPANDYNTYNLNQGDFLVWSSNNGDINNISDNDTSAATISNLPEKRWIMQKSGKTAGNIPTQVVFDASQVDSAGRCLLLINRNADGMFENATTEIYQPDSIDIMSKYYFNNIKWDTDSSGRDIFTFLTGKKLTLLATTSIQNGSQNTTYSVKLDVSGGKSPFIFSLLTGDLQNNINTWTSSDSTQYLYGLANGNYTAIVTDVKGATDTASFEIKNAAILDAVLNNNGNSNSFSENKITVYPNPTHNYFYIDIQLVQKENVVLTYRNIQGKLITEKTLSGSNYYFLYDTFKEKGNYLIEVKTNSISKTTKLVVD